MTVIQWSGHGATNVDVEFGSVRARRRTRHFSKQVSHASFCVSVVIVIIIVIEHTHGFVLRILMVAKRSDGWKSRKMLLANVGKNR
jgi:hypothetical protein